MQPTCKKCRFKVRVNRKKGLFCGLLNEKEITGEILEDCPILLNLVKAQETYLKNVFV